MLLVLHRNRGETGLQGLNKEDGSDGANGVHCDLIIPVRFTEFLKVSIYVILSRTYMNKFQRFKRLIDQEHRLLGEEGRMVH
jgi:hypothetical protein